jgi:hypothetical protein
VGDETHENLLGGVLGVLGVAEEAQRQPIDRVLHLLDQPLECLGVARRGAPGELL